MQKESEATFDDGFALVSRSSRTLELQRFVPPRSVELRIAKSLARHGEIRSMVRDHDILQTPPPPHYSLGPLTQSAVDVPQVLDRLHGDLLSIERRTQKYTPRHHKPSVRSSAPELSSPTKSGVVEVVRLQTRKKCPWSNVTLGSVACCIAGQTERQTPRLRPPQQLRSTTTSRCGATVGVVCVCVWSAQITRAACDPGGVRGQTGVRSSPRRCTTGGFPQLLLPLRAPGSARCSGVRTGAGARTVCLCCSSAAPPSFSHRKASHNREQRACMSVEVRASPSPRPREEMGRRSFSRCMSQRFYVPYPCNPPPSHVGTATYHTREKISQDSLPVLIVLTPPSPSLAACEAKTVPALPI